MYKRKCSNCNIEIQLKNENHRSDLIFCSTKCHYEFTDRDFKIRKQLGWNDLND